MKHLASVVVFLALVAGLATYALGDEPVYNGSQGIALNVQGADSVADLNSTTAYGSRPKVSIGVHQTVTLSVRCTNAGATVKVRIVRGRVDGSGTWTAYSTSSASLTSHSTFTLSAQGATYFPCDDAYFDTSALPYFMVVVDSISAGTCCVGYSVH